MDERQAEALVRAPGEALRVEIKSWLDIDGPEHRAKLVRALLALRNFGGGFLLIGFDDRTGSPAENPPPDPRSSFHVDVLQRLVSTYASEPFGIEVTFVERAGIAYPVIEVPTGVQVPVAIKADLRHETRHLLRRGDVMFRTLGANNTVSSAAAGPGDWRQIMEICFDNREADLARFVRRHLRSSDLPGLLADLGLAMNRVSRPGLQEICREFADECAVRAEQKERARGLLPLPESFGQMEIAAVLDPPASGFIADQGFRDRLMRSHPRYSNDLWMDSRGYPNRGDRPSVDAGGWDALVDLTDWWKMREFSRLEPSGRFYLRRPLPEDSTAHSRGAAPGVILDIEATISNVTEAMATALAFADALGAEPDQGKLGFLVSWGGLQDRRLVSLNGGGELIAFEHRSSTSALERFVELPAGTSALNLAPYVSQLVRELFALFNGYTYSPDRAEAQVRAVVERRRGA
ncbi:hypothetical protein VQH23_12625 [Pararoseomonas sp. SCSIO 73927]|uniref:AlbA family DNA-binding domain-containing protein n=1 Tax=Pararoseomonas sp. SCSIO 73927 TaxID=3114537 RepID=UPI0030CE3D62